MKEISEQIDIFLSLLSIIKENKDNSVNPEKILTDHLYCDKKDYDFDLFMVAHEYCDDEKKAQTEMLNYVSEKNGTKKTEKKERKQIEKICIVVHFLNPISKGNINIFLLLSFFFYLCGTI